MICVLCNKNKSKGETIDNLFVCINCIQHDEKLYVVPCSKERAGEFIYYIHRHHLPLDYATYTIACCTSDGIVHGVGAIGRTTTQHLKLDGISNEWIQEVRRVATDGTRNACSILYAHAWKLVSSIGYRALVSYTLPEEGGSSLRALGWQQVDNVGGNTWAHRSKRGYDIAPTGKKTRWQITTLSSKIPPFASIEWPIYDSVQKSLFGTATLTGEGIGSKIEQHTFMQTGFSENAEFFETPYEKG
jgi:hypothetical protein